MSRFGGEVTIHDMQNFAESMGSSDIQLSDDIGNVISLGENDFMGDDLGLGMLTNTRVSPVQQNNQSSNNVQVSSFGGDGGIEIGTLEPLDGISLDIPFSSSSNNGHQTNMNSNSFPEISIQKDDSSSPFSFENSQTSSAPNIALSNVPRRNPEEEKKEKADLITKLSRLQSKGFQLTRTFTMDNTLDEIKTEFDRLMDAKNLENSIKFQRQMMMGLVTGMEMMNNKFDPFGWQLDGWSESVHENVDDFDEVFEELYDKYKGRGNTPPEARLLFMLAGSGFMFHMSNNYFRSKMANTSMEDILKNNPALAKQFASAAANAAGPGFGNFMGMAMNVPPQQEPPMMSVPNPGAFFQNSNSPSMGGPPLQTPQNLAAQAQQQSVRREMKGPSGVDDILKTFEEIRRAEVDGPPNMMPPQAPSLGMSPSLQAAAEIQSLHSDDMYSQAESNRTGRTGGRRRKMNSSVVGNTMSLNV
jgi:hypothetical protein